MRRFGKFLSAFVAAVILIQAMMTWTGYAHEQSSIPRNISVAMTGDNPDIWTVDGRPHVRLTWDPAIFPVGSDIIDTGYRIYISEGASQPRLLMDRIGSTHTSWEVTRYGDTPLKSGTVYSARITAYHTHRDPVTQRETTDESPLSYSDVVTFLTDINVQVLTAGIDALEIRWDDVKVNGKRIDYDILISRSKDFRPDNTFVYNIRQENIGPLNPVKPVINEEGREQLSFVASGSDFGLAPGTIYYVKLRPRIDALVGGAPVIHNKETAIVVGATYILATMTKMSDTWWKLWWNPVVDPSLGAGEKINYRIKRGNISQWENPVLVTIGETTDTSYYIEVGDQEYFYVVEADIRDQYGIVRTLSSERKTPVSPDVPVKPPVPELFEEIRKPIDNPQGEIIYRHDTEPWLTPTSATVAWKAPRLADGTIDRQVVYDIWLSPDPSVLGSDTSIQPVRREYSVPGPDYISIESQVVAFSYVFSGLDPNRPYYLKIIAKKSFTVEENGQLVVKFFESDPAVKMIVTPPKGPIDQPVAPAKPPFRVKMVTDPSGKERPDVGIYNAWVEWRNSWKEIWTGTGWKMVEEDEDTGDSIYRYVTYDEEVTFSIGYAVFEEGMDYESIRDLPMQITGIKNDMKNVRQYYNIEGLKPNTAYIMWIKALRPDYRQPGSFLESEPSDPVIVVTLPEPGSFIVKPAVPAFTYSMAGDTYVELKWNYKPEYTYYIRYSEREDGLASAKEITVTPTDLLKLKGQIRIEGLNPNTVYYFWIQADSTGQRIEEGLSYFSDSYMVKTLPYSPPDTPKGFGVKNSEDAIGKDYVIVEWIQAEGLEYLIQVSEDSSFSKFVEYKAGKVGEYKVEGLRSNFRYYMRLFAYDPEKKLYSLPTNSIAVRTLKSDDEYDSGEYPEDVIVGEIIQTEYSNGVWTLKITGVNADRFIEMALNDGILDYVIDLTKSPSGTTRKVLIISNRVLRAFSRMKEYIILDNGYVTYTLKPFVFETEDEKRLVSSGNDFDVELVLTDHGQRGATAGEGLTYYTKASGMSIRFLDGSFGIPVRKFNQPLEVSLSYSDSGVFTNGLREVYYYTEQERTWSRQDSVKKFDDLLGKGYATIRVLEPGRAAILTATGTGGRYSDITSPRQRQAIEGILQKYELKSVPGIFFRPNEYVTAEFGCKLLMDVLGYQYGQDYLEKALKAGFIDLQGMENPRRVLSRNEVSDMLKKLYRLKTGSSGPERNSASEGSGPVTRGEFIVEIYNMLVETGEI